MDNDNKLKFEDIFNYIDENSPTSPIYKRRLNNVTYQSLDIITMDFNSPCHRSDKFREQMSPT